VKELLRYVNPKGPLPDIAGTKSGDLLVMGTAACLWDDLSRYDDQHKGERLAVNDAIFYYPVFASFKLNHGVSLHCDFLSVYTHGSPSLPTHSNISSNGGHPTHVWPLQRDGGTGGLFAVLIGLLMGFDRIILAGSPIDGSGHFYYPGKTALYGDSIVRDEWLRARDAVFKGKVKSLSGCTREWLGEP